MSFVKEEITELTNRIGYPALLYFSLILANPSTKSEVMNCLKIYRNFKDHKCYKELRPTANQPARLFATAKTHKFESYKNININDLKLRPIIDQTGTHTYKASK